MGGLSDRALDIDVEQDRWGRVLLGRLAEGGDERVARRIRAVGGATAAREVLTGASPLPHAPSLQARLARCPTGRAVPSGGLDGSLADAVDDDLRAAERIGARYVTPLDAEWPTQLDDLGDRAPWGLWVVGAAHLRLLALRSVSVVGARAATAYGETIARSLAGELGSRQWLVASGGAFGIDAAAHRGALGAGGSTACVLAGGVDVPYPRSHAALLASVCENGLLVSESPMGAAPMRQRFLQRNRLIAALTRSTVVVEAALRSGSLTTARQARDLNRPVLAFPGPITSPMSAGAHALIRDGDALLVMDVPDALALMGAESVLPGGSEPAAADDRATDLSPRDARVLDAVPVRAQAPLDRLARTAGLPPTEVLIAVGVLEARGLVRRGDHGWVKSRG